MSAFLPFLPFLLSIFSSPVLWSWQLVRWLRLWDMRVQISNIFVNTVNTWNQPGLTIFNMFCRLVWDQLSHSCWIRTRYQSFSLRFPPWCRPVLRHHHLDRLHTSINALNKRIYMVWVDMSLWNPNYFTYFVCLMFVSVYRTQASTAWSEN